MVKETQQRPYANAQTCFHSDKGGSPTVLISKRKADLIIPDRGSRNL
jgi:hypothetical protein